MSTPELALEKALALSRLNPPVYVVPCFRRGKAKGPLTPKGFYDASVDESEIRGLWSRYPGAYVGVWPGPSLLLIEDLDVYPENGFDSADHAELDWESKVHYSTPSGGEHHIWPLAAQEGAPGPAAPIKGLPGIDRRSGDSLCLWYGPSPTQEQWEIMRSQTTPEWLLAAGGRRTSSGRPAVSPVGMEEVRVWLDELTDGPARDEYVVPTEHHGQTVAALVALVEATRSFPGLPGWRETFEVLADGYVNSPVASSPNRDRKILEILRWALAKTSDVPDLSKVLTWLQGVQGQVVDSRVVDFLESFDPSAHTPHTIAGEQEASDD